MDYGLEKSRNISCPCPDVLHTALYRRRYMKPITVKQAISIVKKSFQQYKKDRKAYDKKRRV
jgi:hypothetical protein